MITLLALLLALLQPAPTTPGCLALGDAQSFYSCYFAAPHPTYSLYVTAPADYQLSVPGEDLHEGALPAAGALALDGPASVSIAAPDPFRMYLCQGGAQPTWVYLPVVR
jgi:hypothetical protein